MGALVREVVSVRTHSVALAGCPPDTWADGTGAPHDLTSRASAVNSAASPSRQRCNSACTARCAQADVAPSTSAGPHDLRAAPLADVLRRLDRYDFRDPLGHPLRNCNEFRELVRRAEPPAAQEAA